MKKKNFSKEGIIKKSDWLYLSGYAFKRFSFGNKKMETWGILSIKKAF
jgi:hypothetical protein